MHIGVSLRCTLVLYIFSLLAMGMAQFHHLKESKDYVQKFMLPCKSKKQIQTRIKNLVAKSAKDNAVKVRLIVQGSNIIIHIQLIPLL